MDNEMARVLKLALRGGIFAAVLWAFLAGYFSLSPCEDLPRSYGLDSRPTAKAYLRMPDHLDGLLPALLSQTGAFQDTRNLIPSGSLIPYDINVSFWSDGAAKSRWISVPGGASSPDPKIKFAPTGEWNFPNGTVFVKHFELATDETRPELK